MNFLVIFPFGLEQQMTMKVSILGLIYLVQKEAFTLPCTPTNRNNTDGSFNLHKSVNGIWVHFKLATFIIVNELYWSSCIAWLCIVGVVAILFWERDRVCHLLHHSLAVFFVLQMLLWVLQQWVSVIDGGLFIWWVLKRVRALKYREMLTGPSASTSFLNLQERFF